MIVLTHESVVVCVPETLTQCFGNLTPVFPTSNNVQSSVLSETINIVYTLRWDISSQQKVGSFNKQDILKF